MMTIYSFRLVPPLALLLFSLAGISTPVVLADARCDRPAFSPEYISRGPIRRGEVSGQAQGSTSEQNRQEPDTGKKKSLHHYDPEDVFHETREVENLRQRKQQLRQPKALTKTLVSSATAPTPEPKITTMPSTPETLVAPLSAVVSSLPQRFDKPRAALWKLLIYALLILAVLFGLIYTIIR